jgi:hypothetical protein
MDAKRDMLNRLLEAHRRHDAKLQSIKGNPAGMKRWITVRKGLRLMMESVAQ